MHALFRFSTPFFTEPPFVLFPRFPATKSGGNQEGSYSKNFYGRGDGLVASSTTKRHEKVEDEGEKPTKQASGEGGRITSGFYRNAQRWGGMITDELLYNVPRMRGGQ